jgi:putative drug exporter of the RND superfamily
MMLFAILFGLSMDYEIFMLSRIREEYLRTGDNASAVANELANTARVITAAAAIMVMLFLSFVFGFEERAIKLFGVFVFGFEERAIKLFGVGLAVAIAGRRPTNSACSSASGSSTSTSTRCSRRSLRRATSAGAAARGA